MQASDSSASAAAPGKDRGLPQESKFSKILEFIFVLTLAAFIFTTQTFVTAPKLALLFDSQAYLWVSQACQRALAPESLGEIWTYLSGGCRDEILRTAIVSHLPGILELNKSGPLLPLILLISYGISGKELSMEHWNVGAIAMIFISSLGIGGIWLWSRSLAGVAASRIAVLLALTYSGFIVNSGRILLELPSATLAIYSLYAIYSLAKILSHDASTIIEEGDRQKRRKLKKQALFSSLAAGIVCGLLMLGRPTMLPLPLLMAFCLFIYSHVSRNKNIFRPAILILFTLGIALSLSPWILVKKIITGTPSVVIERYGPLNLAVGQDLRTDGWDALPSPLVAHPDRFKKSSSEVLSELLKQFKERPAAVIHLLMRKPVRLLDSPWNDFQVKTFGLPFLLQRFEHQLILLASVLGVVLLLEHGRKRPNYLMLLGGLLIGSFLAFHLVMCLFISMSRYFVTAMPVAIVAASYFFSFLLKEGKRAWQAALACLLTPLVSMLLYYMLVPGYGRISDLSSDLGLAQLSMLAAFLMTACLCAGLLWPAFSFFRGARSKMILGGLSLIFGFCSLISVCYHFMCSEAVLRLGSIDKEKMIASTTIPPGESCQSWYLIIDANDASSSHGEAEKENGILTGMNVQVNGRDIKADWLPLTAMDESARESFMSMAVFAYSSGRRVSDFRQWLCTALPPENINSSGENKIIFSMDESEKQQPKIFADFTDPLGKRIHTVSLREFSWSKGFFADCPGEMRLDQWPNNSERNFDLFRLCGQTSRLKPRAYLLGVKNSINGETWMRSINLSDQKIGSKDKLISSQEISPVPGLAELGPGQSIRIKVSGQLRNPDQKAEASVCLLETFSHPGSSFQEYAALSPERIKASKDWREFSFEEIVNPLRAFASDGKVLSSPSKLSALKVMYLRRPWWEVLDYGIFKANGKIEFRNMKIELSGQPTLDMSKSDSRFFELDTQFKAAQ
ncbi:MAG: hypothetical protein K2X27_05390 [Candidatus Obscuribacterales bacterium]|nr:hypothetical protein [Candidatus Obscuribacterales bacterium]